MILYRPFLHYASQSTQTRSVDKRSYACAAACVSVSRNIVHITSEMQRNGLLTGAYWFAMYTTFFAVLSLVFYVIENPHNAASQEILRDAREGKDTLACLAPRSMAADRSSQYLAVGILVQSNLPAAKHVSRRFSNSSLKHSNPVDWFQYHRKSGRHLRGAPITPKPRLIRMPEQKTAMGKVRSVRLVRRTWTGQVLPGLVITHHIVVSQSQKFSPHFVQDHGKRLLQLI